MRDWSHIPVRIKGQLANLVAPLTGDGIAEDVHRWMADEEFCAWIGEIGEVVSLDTARDRVRSMATWMPDERHFSIVDAESGQHIGNCSIEVMGRTNAMLGILIGSKEHRGHGIGTEVMRMLCSFAFDEMGMHRVTLEVAAENTRARRCYKKAGFVECGTEHEVAWYHGRWNDCIRMEMLASDWEREKVDSDAKECADDMDVPEEESPKPSE